MTIHEGGCLCGAVRYRVKAEPPRVSACHCRNCQKRTGSAFGAAGYFHEADVEFVRGEPRAYEFRSDESGRWLRNFFCPACGTTVSWTAESMPGLRGVAIGTFDDPKWLRPSRHGWMRSALGWVLPAPDAQTFETGAWLKK